MSLTYCRALAEWLSWLERCSHAPKGCGLNPRSGNIPTLWVHSPVRMCMGGHQLMFLTSVFLSLFLSLPLLLSLFKKKKGYMNIYPWVRIFKKRIFFKKRKYCWKKPRVKKNFGGHLILVSMFLYFRNIAIHRLCFENYFTIPRNSRIQLSTTCTSEQTLSAVFTRYIRLPCPTCPAISQARFLLLQGPLPLKEVFPLSMECPLPPQ